MVKVYVKVDSDSLITEVNSEIFMESIDGYALIDEGEGDRFTHAQGNYLESGLMDEQGRYNYRLLDGNAVLLTEEEKQELSRLSSRNCPSRKDSMLLSCLN